MRDPFGAVLGLPLHPLVVHAVVVLVPLVTVGLLVAVARPLWAERLRLPLVALGWGAAASAVVARLSGQRLLGAVPGSPEVARHADLADLLALGVVGFALVLTAWAFAGRDGTGARWIGWTAAAVGVLVTGWTVLAGHSGAVAVWGDVVIG
jgi:hypothetical protein